MVYTNFKRGNFLISFRNNFLSKTLDMIEQVFSLVDFTFLFVLYLNLDENLL